MTQFSKKVSKNHKILIFPVMNQLWIVQNKHYKHILRQMNSRITKNQKETKVKPCLQAEEAEWKNDQYVTSA